VHFVMVMEMIQWSKRSAVLASAVRANRGLIEGGFSAFYRKYLESAGRHFPLSLIYPLHIVFTHYSLLTYKSSNHF
jgi:hypothetical protein